MEKNNETSDSKTADQEIEPGLSLLQEIPNITCRMLSLTDSRCYLYYHDESDNAVRISRAENPPPFSRWKFYSLGNDIYNIRAYPHDHLYMTRNFAKIIYARPHSGDDEQRWKVLDAGNGFIYIKGVGTEEPRGYLSPYPNLEEDSIAFVGEFIGGTDKRWMLLLAL